MSDITPPAEAPDPTLGPPAPTADPAERPSESKRLFNLTAVNVILGALGIVGTAFGLSKLHLIEYGIVILALAPAIIRYCIPSVRDSRFWEPILYCTIALAIAGGAFLFIHRATTPNDIGGGNPGRATHGGGRASKGTGSGLHLSPLTRGTITFPKDQSAVDQEIVARGTVSGIRSRHIVMLMLLYGNCYFPERVNLVGNGAWWSTISIGGAEAAGLSFILCLVDVGLNGVTALRRYENAEQARGYAIGICSERELVDKYSATFLYAVQIHRHS